MQNKTQISHIIPERPQDISSIEAILRRSFVAAVVKLQAYELIECLHNDETWNYLSEPCRYLVHLINKGPNSAQMLFSSPNNATLEALVSGVAYKLEQQAWCIPEDALKHIGGRANKLRDTILDAWSITMPAIDYASEWSKIAQELNNVNIKELTTSQIATLEKLQFQTNLPWRFEPSFGMSSPERFVCSFICEGTAAKYYLQALKATTSVNSHFLISLDKQNDCGRITFSLSIHGALAEKRHLTLAQTDNDPLLLQNARTTILGYSIEIPQNTDLSDREFARNLLKSNIGYANWDSHELAMPRSIANALSLSENIIRRKHNIANNEITYAIELRCKDTARLLANALKIVTAKFYKMSASCEDFRTEVTDSSRHVVLIPKEIAESSVWRETIRLNSDIGKILAKIEQLDRTLPLDHPTSRLGEVNLFYSAPLSLGDARKFININTGIDNLTATILHNSDKAVVNTLKQRNSSYQAKTLDLPFSIEELSAPKILTARGLIGELQPYSLCYLAYEKAACKPIAELVLSAILETRQLHFRDLGRIDENTFTILKNEISTIISNACRAHIADIDELFTLIS